METKKEKKEVKKELEDRKIKVNELGSKIRLGRKLKWPGLNTTGKSKKREYGNIKR